jgi:hypothetical protein
MSTMANSMDAFLEFQQALNAGIPVNYLDGGYFELQDEFVSGRRFCYAKVIDSELQVLVTFGSEETINGVDCYSVNYSVGEKYRGRGLAVEAVNIGIEELKNHLSRSNIKKFYVDAIVDETNIHSIEVAKKLFPGPGIAKPDYYSGTPSLYFNRLIVI